MLSLQMAPLKAHGKQGGLWPRCWAGVSNPTWFLGILSAIVGPPFRPHVLRTGSSRGPSGGKACTGFSEPASSAIKQLHPHETPSSRGTVKCQESIAEIA